MSMVFKMLKDLIGKDLSKFSLPVFINEPSSILMKPAEQMFFNQPLHELSSNPQLLYDLTENKVAFTVRNDGKVLPSQLVHERTLETIEGVTGDTPRFATFSMAALTERPEAKAACDAFQQAVAAMATEFGARGGELAPALHPDAVECSIAW